MLIFGGVILQGTTSGTTCFAITFIGSRILRHTLMVTCCHLIPRWHNFGTTQNQAAKHVIKPMTWSISNLNPYHLCKQKMVNCSAGNKKTLQPRFEVVSSYKNPLLCYNLFTSFSWKDSRSVPQILRIYCNLTDVFDRWKRKVANPSVPPLIQKNDETVQPTNFVKAKKVLNHITNTWAMKKTPVCLGFYRGLYYPFMWGL